MVLSLQHQLAEKSDEALLYHKVMQALRRTKMQHGKCEPRSDRACAHCNALEDIEKLLSEYRGPRIIPA